MDLLSASKAFVAKVNGYPVEISDPSNRDQCMDMAFAWCLYIGIPYSVIAHLFAYQVYTQATDETRKYFDLIPHAPGLVPEAGWLAVWRPYGVFTGKAGHIDLVLSAGAHGFTALDQNWGGHVLQKGNPHAGEPYCEVLTHPYIDVIGYVVPKVTVSGQVLSEQVTQGELEMTPEVQAQFDELYRRNEDLKQHIFALANMLGEVARNQGMNAGQIEDLKKHVMNVENKK